MFNLTVQQVEQVCLFELSWGRGQKLGVTLPYPEDLSALYQKWQAVYLSFYRTELRGRVAAMGRFAAPPVDWQAKLVQAEAQLLYEFHNWLRRAELYEIRTTIVRGHALFAENNRQQTIEVFLTCNPLDLARLPWEAWEIGTEFAAKRVQIVRTPLNIRGMTASTQSCRPRRRARVLAILGDETGLDFEADEAAMKSLEPVVQTRFVRKKRGQSAAQLKTEIVQAIAAEPGWDILFFAGHSNETALTGGELAIAPGETLHLAEIIPSLTIAKERGLQFALFNSCNGLSIANALIDLGLSQVAVMREPIHNHVAQEFLVRFLQQLAEYKDVHEALLAACQYLKLEKHFTYPSAHLIPSLFRHPDAQLFRLEPPGIKQQLKRWLPTTKEAIALGAFLIVSLLSPVQDFLIERRIWMQAVYRQVTNQISSQNSPPPVLLVQIDQESLNRAKINDRKINPIDRKYLASLIDRLSALNAKIVGLDYLLDSPNQDEDPELAASVGKAINQKSTWFVFAAVLKRGGQPELGVTNSVARLDQNLQGYINVPEWYVPILPAGGNCATHCPFAYLLALAYALNRDPLAPTLPQPQQLQSRTNFRAQLIDYLNQGKLSGMTAFLHQLRLSPIASFSRHFQQMWLQPILDFSVPPEQAYDHVPAWQLLSNSADKLTPNRLKQQVVIIAAGGYDQAGVTQPGSDNFSIPMAVDYWRMRQAHATYPPAFTGAEAHAYTLHHLLTRRLVVPIPDFWLVAIALFVGKGMQLVLIEYQHSIRRWQLVALVSATAVYGLVGLQVYISAAVLLPWFLPSAAFWAYLMPALRIKFQQKWQNN